MGLADTLAKLVLLGDPREVEVRYRTAAASSAARDRDSDSFRRLVRKEISADDYVRSLERRVREQREDTENGRTDEDAGSADSDEP